jgi:hypothetical protein
MDEVSGVDASAVARGEYKGWVVLKGRIEMGEGMGKGRCIAEN